MFLPRTHSTQPFWWPFPFPFFYLLLLVLSFFFNFEDLLETTFIMFLYISETSFSR